MHGCQVKGSLVLIIPEVQAFYPHPLGMFLIHLLLKCHPPLSNDSIGEVTVFDHHGLSCNRLLMLLMFHQTRNDELQWKDGNYYTEAQCEAVVLCGNNHWIITPNLTRSIQIDLWPGGPKSY